MFKPSRSAWIAIAAVAAVPATVAIAKTMDGGPPWARVTPETRERLDEGRIAMAKAALKLTPEQEKLWTPVEEQVRAAFKAREAHRDEWAKKREERKAERESGKADEKKRPDLAQRFEKMSTRMSERAERMKAFVGAFKPLYASLSDEQKDVLRPLMRDLAPGFGHRGHHGPRWAHGGGWGPGGREHGGWGGHRRMHGMDRGEGPRDGMNDDSDTAAATPSAPPAGDAGPAEGGEQ
jgi:hypothetical protein